MTLVRQSSTELVICAKNSLIVYNFSTRNNRIVTLPDVKSLAKGNNSRSSDKHEEDTITTATFSKDERYFIVSTFKKQLIVYNHNFDVFNKFILKRGASRLKCTKNNENIIVADKTGEVYVYNLTDDGSEPTLLLGHLSMLLDILVTPCNKYIITCDRDEKIRVSCYPNSYNIVNYCLGHKEFVTNVELVNNVLLSSSGDGTVRFWDFVNGTQINFIDTNKYLTNSDLLHSFCKEMKEEKCEVYNLPITDMQVLRTNERVHIAVTLYMSFDIQIYTVSECMCTKVEWCFLQNITLNSQIESFIFGENIFVLCSEGLYAFKFDGNKYCCVNSDELDFFYRKHCDMIHDNLMINITQLYKRKFDTVQQYFERKKVRIN